MLIVEFSVKDKRLTRYSINFFSFSVLHCLQECFPVPHISGAAMAGPEATLPRTQRLRRPRRCRRRPLAFLLHLIHVQNWEPGK